MSEYNETGRSKAVCFVIVLRVSGKVGSSGDWIWSMAFSGETTLRPIRFSTSLRAVLATSEPSLATQFCIRKLKQREQQHFFAI